MKARHWIEFFDGKTLRKGLAYQRENRVGAVAILSNGLASRVEGLGGDYNVVITWSGRQETRFTNVVGDCSCPVGAQCKHAVALIAEWLALQKEADDGADELADDESRESAPVVKLLPAARGDQAAERWLESIESLTAAPSVESPWIVVLAMAGQRWQVLPMQAKIRKDGGWGIGKRYRCWHDFDPYAVGVSSVLRTFALRATSWHADEPGRDGMLSGELGATGADLATLIDAGLLTIEPLAQGPLRRGPEHPAELRWVDGERGWRLMLVAPALPDDAQVIPVDPPWWINGREIGPLRTMLPPAVLAIILGMPAIPAVRLAGTYAQLLPLIPDLPAPPLTDSALPMPVLRAWRGQLRGEKPGSWGTLRPCDLALVTFRYAGGELPVSGPPVYTAGTRLVARHFPAEQQRLAELARAGFTQTELDGWAITEANLPGGTIFSMAGGSITPAALAVLRATGWDISGRAAETVPITDLARLDATLVEDDGWFDLALGTAIDGQRIDLVPLLTPLLRGGPSAWQQLPQVAGAVLLTHGPEQVLRVPLTVLQALHDHLIALFGRERSPGGRWRLDVWDAGMVDVLDGLGARVIGGERLREIATALSGPLLPAPAPPGLRAELRPYQLDGLAWLQRLRSVGLGGILADDMGLGKTVQAIAHLEVERAAGRLDRPCLVICPASLIGTWKRELERFAPQLPPVVLHGGKRELAQLIAGAIGITTYATLARDAEKLAAIPLHIAICDEAQAVKNAATRSAQAVRSLDARQRLCLTGTPMENHLGELHAQVSWVASGLLGTKAAFDDFYVKAIEASVPGRAALLRQRLKPVLLRRTKEQVAPELPPRSESVITVELGDRQRRLYEAIRLAMDTRVREAIAVKGLARSHLDVLEALLRLRQVCCDPVLLGSPEGAACGESAKLDCLAELLPSLLEDGRRILLFSQFTSFLDRIEEVVVKPLGIPWLRLDGQTRDRQTLVDRFQNQESPLFLLSLKAGGTGLTLTAADTVILADPWWNPAAEAQAADRAHRIGQDKPVLIYRLVAAGTVEEKVIAMQARKKALADALYDETGQSLGQLTADDLTALLAPVV